MHIEFDPVKDASNQAKHGLSLGMANELDWESALVWVDDRFEYNEARRIISLRRANRREVKHYVDNF
jgi:uncharacterized DUF497 family protein